MDEFNAKGKKITKMTPEAVLQKYKPRRDCRHCLGRGYERIVTGPKESDRQKLICACVRRQIPDGEAVELVAEKTAA